MPASNLAVVQDSLAAHLPVAERPLEVAGFLDRVQRQIEARWRVQLPPAAPLQVPAQPVVLTMPAMPPAGALPVVMPPGAVLPMMPPVVPGAPEAALQQGAAGAAPPGLPPLQPEQQELQQQEVKPGVAELLAAGATLETGAGGAPLGGDAYAAHQQQQQQAFTDMLHS